MNDVKEEIKARLSIEDVVSQYIELKRAGSNFKGRSPWGVDKTPSFMVSPEKGIWHDFSANKGGDVFTFLMEVEGITFKEALEKLAEQAGVELAKYTGGDREVAKKKQRMKEALELACRFYQLCLVKNKPICEYVFYKRNMNRGTVQNFRIGYAPKSGRALRNILEKKGFSEKEMRDAGLLNRFGGDLFKGRMMIPFMDTTGNVIGFTARVLDKSEPKYLNTPETLLFNKGRFVFGLTQAKEAIRENNFCVIVEGNMDVISSHQAGVREAIATSGTAMTEQHLKILSRLTPDVRLAYDGDAAGIKATERAIMMAGNLGIDLTVISDYHGAKDPDELIRKDPKLWQEAVNNRLPAVEWLLNKYEEKLDLTTGDGKRHYSDVAMRLIGYLSDSVEKVHYEQLVARRLEVTVEDLRQKKIPESGKKILKTVKNDQKTAKITIVEKNLLAILLFGGIEANFEMKKPENKEKIDELELIFKQRYENWEKDILQKEALELKRTYDEEIKKHQIAELNAELEEAEGDDERIKEILRKITVLQKNK